MKFGDLPKDLSEAAQADLIEVYTVLNNESSDIKAQLEEARAKYGREGTYSDPEWYRKASQALRIKQKIIRRVQAEFKRRKDDPRHRSVRPLFRVDALDREGCNQKILEDHLNTISGWFVGCVTTPTEVLVIRRLSAGDDESQKVEGP